MRIFSLILIAAAILKHEVSFSQTNIPAIQWRKSFGGSLAEYAQSIAKTKDGGYILAGSAESNDGNVTGQHGVRDFWIVKLDSASNIEWQKTMGGSGLDEAMSIQQTSDGGYIAAGLTQSNDGDVSGLHGDLSLHYNDYWVVKIDNAGNIQWQHALGGSYDDIAYAVRQTKDGGYLVAGYTVSNDGDVSRKHGGADYWIVKLDTNGKLQHQQCYGGNGDDIARDIRETKDNGFIVTGQTLSDNGDVKGNNGYADMWVVKVNRKGTIDWQKCYGGPDWDGGSSLDVTDDGGYVVAGWATLNGGDVKGVHGSTDYWVVKITGSGKLIWQKALGGSNRDDLRTIKQTHDGGYIMTGYTESDDGDVHDNRGIDNYWVVKLNRESNLEWEKTFGGSGRDLADDIEQTNDNGFIIAGHASSIDGEINDNLGDEDYWIVKLTPDIRGLPRVTVSATTDFICQRDSIPDTITYTANVINPGINYRYQWQKNNQNAGTSSPVFKVSNITSNYQVSCLFTRYLPNGDSLTSSGNLSFFTIENIPDKPGVISGPAEVYSDQDSLVYSIPAIANVIYNWKMPPGAEILSGQGTSSVLVNWGTQSGFIKVTAGNSCGISPARNLNVTVQSGISYYKQTTEK